jgi:hypothetical protein
MDFPQSGTDPSFGFSEILRKHFGNTNKTGFYNGTKFVVAEKRSRVVFF